MADPEHEAWKTLAATAAPTTYMAQGTPATAEKMRSARLSHVYLPNQGCAICGKWQGRREDGARSQPRLGRAGSGECSERRCDQLVRRGFKAGRRCLGTSTELHCVIEKDKKWVKSHHEGRSARRDALVAEERSRRVCLVQQHPQARNCRGDNDDAAVGAKGQAQGRGSGGRGFGTGESSKNHSSQRRRSRAPLPHN